MSQDELDQAMEKLDSLMDRYASRDQQEMSPEDEKRLSDFVHLMLTAE